MKLHTNAIKHGSCRVLYVDGNGVQLDAGLIIIHLPSTSSLALTFPFSDCCLNQVSTLVLEELRIKDLLSHSEVSVTLGRHVISR